MTANPEPASKIGADQALLSLRGITKRFGSLAANDDITLHLQAGEVLALLGENGAGKSTLVSILFGHYSADAGQILIDGTPLPPGDPAAALARGIGMVHQHFALADNLTVLENIIAGTRPMTAWSLQLDKARAAIRATAQRFGLELDPWARVGDLSVGERQRVEILKALYRGARILILDEPTAVLTPQESESLFATLGQLVAQGLAIIFISHKLDEVMRVSDRIAVLRAGRLVATLSRDAATSEHLGEIMVGQRVDTVRRARPGDGRTSTTEPAAADAPDRICLHEASVLAADGRRLLDSVSLAVPSGSILGIAGVSGNGQSTLADVLCGITSLDSGRLTIDTQTMRADPRQFTTLGVARIPEDRHELGVVGELSVWENLLIERVREPAFSRFGVLRRGAARRHAQAVVANYDVRGLDSAGLATPTRRLSGGNMQKLILGRALTGSPTRHANESRVPAAIIANQPTWGLDVGAVAFVHRQLLAAADAGSAIVLISEDLDELFAIASSIAVMHGGRLTPARATEAWTMSAIGAAMAGTVVG